VREGHTQIRTGSAPRGAKKKGEEDRRKKGCLNHFAGIRPTISAIRLPNHLHPSSHLHIQQALFMPCMVQSVPLPTKWGILNYLWGGTPSVLSSDPVHRGISFGGSDRGHPPFQARPPRNSSRPAPREFDRVGLGTIARHEGLKERLLVFAIMIPYRMAFALGKAKCFLHGSEKLLRLQKPGLYIPDE
jgi:hypothetical protein